MKGALFPFNQRKRETFAAAVERQEPAIVNLRCVRLGFKKQAAGRACRRGRAAASHHSILFLDGAAQQQLRWRDEGKSADIIMIGETSRDKGGVVIMIGETKSRSQETRQKCT